MSFLYDFPINAAFGKFLPQTKIYEHSSPTTAVKKLFVQDVEKIIWSYKLSPETINLPAKDFVQEIQVFTILLKNKNLKYEVLGAIDKAIKSPILFVLSFGNKLRYVAAYKRPSEADKNKWVVSQYFESEWMSDKTEKVVLPVVLDLKTLYYSILKSVIPHSVRQNETVDTFVDRMEKLKIKEREVVKLQTRLNKEKQFNRKVKMNAELRILNNEIDDLNR